MWEWVVVVLVGLPLAWFARWWIRSASRFRAGAASDRAQQSKDALFFWCYRPVGDEARGVPRGRMFAARGIDDEKRPA
ncbi:MAG: hypothetical protein KBD56_07515 [Candidatus Eisenbacteria bacterium]|nr:hypothetical protein [Candidatus Eisenbacteria bacterium]